jgi:hypothetical protein
VEKTASLKKQKPLNILKGKRKIAKTIFGLLATDESSF